MTVNHSEVIEDPYQASTTHWEAQPTEAEAPPDNLYDMIPSARVVRHGRGVICAADGVRGYRELLPEEVNPFYELRDPHELPLAIRTYRMLDYNSPAAIHHRQLFARIVERIDAQHPNIVLGLE